MILEQNTLLVMWTQNWPYWKIKTNQQFNKNQAELRVLLDQSPVRNTPVKWIIISCKTLLTDTPNS